MKLYLKMQMILQSVRKINGQINFFVSIYSKNLLYIYDNMTENIEKISRSRTTKWIFNDIKADDIIIPAEAANYLKIGITKSQIEDWYKFVNANNGLRMFVLSGLCYFNHQSSNLEKTLGEYYEKDKSLLRYIIANSEDAYEDSKLNTILFICI